MGLSRRAHKLICKENPQGGWHGVGEEERTFGGNVVFGLYSVVSRRGEHSQNEDRVGVGR